jgi:hypothetical protein
MSSAAAHCNYIALGWGCNRSGRATWSQLPTQSSIPYTMFIASHTPCVCACTDLFHSPQNLGGQYNTPPWLATWGSTTPTLDHYPCYVHPHIKCESFCDTVNCCCRWCCCARKLLCVPFVNMSTVPLCTGDTLKRHCWPFLLKPVLIQYSIIKTSKPSRQIYSRLKWLIW